MSHILEETKFDETFDYPNGSTVFSPGGTFNVSTENFEAVRLPRTSSPIQPDLPKYTNEEKREIWRRRVLLKKPILFTCSNHRHPKKSYKYQHRLLQRRRIKIDDPRCRTPTPTALRTSWTRFEDVVKREGILSSPAHIELIEFENHVSPTKNDAAGCTGISEATDEDLGGGQNISDENYNPFSSSSDSFKALQLEIVNKVKQDIAQDNFHPKFKQANERKDGRSYWDCVMKTRRSYVSRRTPRFKLARKKAQLVRSGLMNLLSPSSESEETISPEHSLKKRRVNPNYNRNASGVSSEDSSAYLDESCHPRSEDSSTMSVSSCVYDGEDGRMKNQISEQFPIPVVEPSCRRFPRRGKREYHALDEISEHDEEDPGDQDNGGRGPSAVTTSLHRSWSSNPNLIVIIPDNTNASVNPIEKHSELRRCKSSPNIKSLTPLIHFQDKNETQTIAADVVKIKRETEARHPAHMRRDVPNSANIKNKIAHSGKSTNAYHSNIVTTERMNGNTGEPFLRCGTMDNKIHVEDLDRNPNPPQYQKHFDTDRNPNLPQYQKHFDTDRNPNLPQYQKQFDTDRNPNLPQYQKHFDTDRNNGPYDKTGSVYYNNNRRQESQQKPQQFQKCHDPSFRGFGLNDKYHFYKQANVANAQQSGGSKILKGACGPGNIQVENQATRESRGGPLDHPPTQRNSYEQWRKDHLAHGSNPDCPCYDCDPNCNRYNAQTTRMHTQPFPEEGRSNGENLQVDDITTQDANRPNARNGRPPQQMPYSRNAPLLQRGPQCPPPQGNVRTPYRRPFQFYGPTGPFRRMPPPVGVPLPPSLRFTMRRPPFLGMIPTHFPPPCRFPFFLPRMPQRVPRNFP